MRPDDIRFMKTALTLAARGLGQVAPNPTVGCVIVREEEEGPRTGGRGWTQPGGRPHAETEALARAGEFAQGGTPYVSFEPGSSRAKTCTRTDALNQAGSARVAFS